MKFFADFHIHSHYSRATSKDMNVRELVRWAQLKGTNVIGTGDFTHPKWFKEMQETLVPAEEGLFKLTSKLEADVARGVPETCRVPMRFLLTVEVSTIYKRGGKVRKVHSLILAPSFAAVERLNARLSQIGNLHSDGRPILGLDTEELLKIALDVSPDMMLIPAHAWTPHFAVFGSQSGFDALEEAFGDNAKYIYAIETGLSSDPAMNRTLPHLDRLALISNSDAHSPRKLGREANIFSTDLSYSAITNALKTNDPDAFESTIEFYPEEGKYHLDGHRNCNVRLTPEETKKRAGICPVCGRSVIVGVMNRIASLGDREENAKMVKKTSRKSLVKSGTGRPFSSIIPLPEIIAEVLGVGLQSKRVDTVFFKLLAEIGNEFSVLLDAPLKNIEASGGSLLAEAVSRMRSGKIHIDPGYDGEYGTIKIFDDDEREQFFSAPTKQGELFT